MVADGEPFAAGTPAEGAALNRGLKPRATATIAVAPATVTDRTCAAVLGLEPRVFRELVARERVPHVRLGRRVVVRVDDMLAALDRLARAEQPTEQPAARQRQPDTPDGVLAALGYERAR